MRRTQWTRSILYGVATLSLGLAPAALGQCPASSCSGSACTLTQSLDTITNGANQVACGNPTGTTPNGWARCFDLIDGEGLPPGAFTVESVTFGVQQATADGINININIYTDSDGCPPVTPGGDAVLVTSEAIVVNIIDEETFITVPITAMPVIPSGVDLIVEIEQVDDGSVAPGFSFRPMSNGNGQCGPSYLRAADCGVPDWTDAAAIGFPDAQTILIIEGTLAGGPTCPADVNGDLVVDVLDLLALLAAWGNTSGPEDINGDGIVDVLDLLELLANWGPCP